MSEFAMVRYAQVLAILLAVIGIAGLLLGEQHLLGAINIDLIEDGLHVASAGVLGFLAFRRVRVEHLRNALLGFGVLYALLGVLGWVSPTLGGIIPHAYTSIDNVIHLGIGVATLGVALATRRDDARGVLRRAA